MTIIYRDILYKNNNKNHNNNDKNNTETLCKQKVSKWKWKSERGSNTKKHISIKICFVQQPMGKNNGYLFENLPFRIMLLRDQYIV